jgi:hypothetical protein
VYKLSIFLLLLSISIPYITEGKEDNVDSIGIEFLGMNSIIPSPGKPAHFNGSIQENQIYTYAKEIDSERMKSISSCLKKIKENHSINDWLFYQLIRRTAEHCISKKEDYVGYTIYKWYLLKSCGYEPLISISANKILLYVKSNDAIYNMPLKNLNNNQYVCLNYHDYNFDIELDKEKITNLIDLYQEGENFSFNINEIPSIDKQAYESRKIYFTYKQKEEQIDLLVNPELNGYFKNYPVTDYQNQFNIPLSKVTYQSLINALRQKVNKLTVNEGVEYLMYFTRNGFEFENDTKAFGREKRLSPEETLLSEKSDCEDRSALLYFLIKEIYNLPMIVLSYPEHITIAVKLDKPVKHQIIYKGESFTICEPTPQKKEFKLGEQSIEMSKQPYEIAFTYHPR